MGPGCFSDIKSSGVWPHGLSSKRAAARFARVGPNSIEKSPRLSAFRLFLRQFENPLVLILVFAATISLVLRQWVDASIILAIILQFVSQLLSRIQRIEGGRGTKATPCVDVPSDTGRCRADSARQCYCARRHHPSCSGQSDPGRWPRNRSRRLPCQRSEHDRRVVSRGEAARHGPGLMRP